MQSESVDAPRSLTATLRAFRHGAHDRTTRLDRSSFLRATYTPDGPATLRLSWIDDLGQVEAEAWGPGSDWMFAQVGSMTGDDDRAIHFMGANPVVERALRRQQTRRIGASGDLYHELIPVILAQRITAGEAIKQWYGLCDKLGEPAPGPAEVIGDLRLPPAPQVLARRPPWWFHPLGIEQKRAIALSEVGVHATKMWDWAAAGTVAASTKLQLLRNVGVWTTSSVVGPALGDPDSVIVGDFHFPNIIAWAMAGEPRADDDRMLELLEPYAGQRGRVQHALIRMSGKAPSFAPKKRTLPISRW